ncbi:hypothetical protein BpHYR1_045832 [Brachionus plicatilis]|uniref:Uncharacterized protein n=1 Tax=Brachionus plicatilis TaxID=10195 RepID=A0A3M7RQN8_BRAPC|nr:hypothetical protein BpHYR1_045832 [Brachionus plicatilis]
MTGTSRIAVVAGLDAWTLINHLVKVFSIIQYCYQNLFINQSIHLSLKNDSVRKISSYTQKLKK